TLLQSTSEIHASLKLECPASDLVVEYAKRGKPALKAYVRSAAYSQNKQQNRFLCKALFDIPFEGLPQRHVEVLQINDFMTAAGFDIAEYLVFPGEIVVDQETVWQSEIQDFAKRLDCSFVTAKFTLQGSQIQVMRRLVRIGFDSLSKKVDGFFGRAF